MQEPLSDPAQIMYKAPASHLNELELIKVLKELSELIKKEMRSYTHPLLFFLS
jgi:hypothetical protein